MRAFHAAVTTGKSGQNTVEDARNDMTLLVDFARLALAHEAGA
jgi:hypothetical protein